MDNLSFYVHSNHRYGTHMRSILWFLTWLCYLCGCHCGMVILFACLHIRGRHPTICAMFISLHYITLCFYQCYLFGTLVGIDNALLVSIVVMPSSHNIIASLCYCTIDRFILVVAILRYDYRPTLNTIVRKLSMVGTCRPWTSFWSSSITMHFLKTPIPYFTPYYFLW